MLRKVWSAVSIAMIFIVVGCGGGGFKSTTTPAPTIRPIKSAVFMGDSLTLGWNLALYFPGSDYTNVGIGGQGTDKMLARFDTDVIAAHPDLVVIWGGTNSFQWENDQLIESQLQAMYEKASTAKIRIVACTISPRRADGVDPNDYTPRILAVNAWIREYALSHGIPVADYYPILADSQGWLKVEYANDHVHLNAAGYSLITPILKTAIAKAEIIE
jgi:lysophospholipase L1-like esterase